MCVLRVTGRQFDPDLHLAQSGLNAIKVFHAGELRSRSRADSKQYTTSGLTIDVSDHSGDNLSGQIADAVAFLKEHEPAIARLRSAPGVEDTRSDFLVDLRLA